MKHDMDEWLWEHVWKKILDSWDVSGKLVGGKLTKHFIYQILWHVYTECYASRDVLPAMDKWCSGLVSCALPIALFVAMTNPCHTQLRSYLQARYTCIPGKHNLSKKFFQLIWMNKQMTVFVMHNLELIICSFNYFSLLHYVVIFSV